MWGKKKLICFWKETVKFLENIKKEHGKNHSETKRKIIKIIQINDTGIKRFDVWVVLPFTYFSTIELKSGEVISVLYFDKKLVTTFSA